MAQLKPSPPGRMITSVPTKPPVTSAQRRPDTRSPRVSDASRVMSSGVTMMMAVNSPTGMCCRLKNARPLLASSSTPRRHWNFGCAVGGSDQPRLGRTASVVVTAWKA